MSRGHSSVIVVSLYEFIRKVFTTYHYTLILNNTPITLCIGNNFLSAKFTEIE